MSPKILLTLLFLSASAVLGVSAKENTIVLYNQFVGHVSDGKKVEGVGWWRPDAETGQFCMMIGEAVCSGDYPANTLPVINGAFECSDGIAGTFIVTREPYGDLVLPRDGSAVLSDGRSGLVIFGPLQQGEIETPCDALSGGGTV